jgi:predicted PurR-regulated permease PerM
LKINIIKFFNFTFFSNILGSVISFTGTFFFSLFSVIFLSFFFMMEPAMLPGVILRMTPSHLKESIRNVMSKSRILLSRYFIGLFIQIIANITTYSVALYLVGVPNALVIGFFSGVIIIIPYLGGIISMLMGVLIGATGVISLGDYNLMMPMIIKILIAMFVVQTIDNNVFAPLIQGKSVKAHPVEIFLVVIAAATIGGILAMIVAVPAYGFIKIIVGEIRSTFAERKGLS